MEVSLDGFAGNRALAGAQQCTRFTDWFPRSFGFPEFQQRIQHVVFHPVWTRIEGRDLD